MTVGNSFFRPFIFFEVSKFINYDICDGSDIYKEYSGSDSEKLKCEVSGLKSELMGM